MSGHPITSDPAPAPEPAPEHPSSNGQGTPNKNQ